jgi:hypothetical protein
VNRDWDDYKQSNDLKFDEYDREQGRTDESPWGKEEESDG